MIHVYGDTIQIMGKVIGFSNHKGGTAKSTTVINTAGVLAEKGYRVLVIDLDPQASLSLGLGVDIGELKKPLLGDILLEPRVYSLQQATIAIKENIDIVPTNILLADTGFVLMGAQARELRLRKVIQPIKNQYDYILVDSPPSKSVLTVNVLAASDFLVIPASTSYYSEIGVQLLLQSIEEARYDLNPRLQVAGILPTRFKTNAIESRQSLNELREYLGENVHIFDTVIREAESLNKAHRFAETIIEFDPKHRAAHDYRAFVEELLGEIEKHER
jgi:chromosome partitioning protein